jgi:hypothetical protein
MPSISDTTYRRLKSNPSAKELKEAFTPSVFELVYAEDHTRDPVYHLGFLLLLKTFQQLVVDRGGTLCGGSMRALWS